MKLENFLVNEAASKNNQTFKSVIETLHKDCKPFLKEWARPQKGKVVQFLIRGGTKRVEGLEKKTVRKD